MRARLPASPVHPSTGTCWVLAVPPLLPLSTRPPALLAGQFALPYDPLVRPAMLTARTVVIAAASIGVLLLGGYAFWESRRRKKQAAVPAVPARESAVNRSARSVDETGSGSAATVRSHIYGAGDMATDLQLPAGASTSQENTDLNGTIHGVCDDASSQNRVTVIFAKTSLEAEDAVQALDAVLEEPAASSVLRSSTSPISPIPMNDEMAVELSAVGKHAHCSPSQSTGSALNHSFAFESDSSREVLSSPNEWVVIEGGNGEAAPEEVDIASGGSFMLQGDCTVVYQDMPRQGAGIPLTSAGKEQTACKPSMSACSDEVSPSVDVNSDPTSCIPPGGAGTDQPVMEASADSGRAGTPEYSPNERPASERFLQSGVGAPDCHSIDAGFGCADVIISDTQRWDVETPSLQTRVDDYGSGYSLLALEGEEPAQLNSVLAMPSSGDGEFRSVDSHESFVLVASSSLAPSDQSFLTSMGQYAGAGDDESWTDIQGAPIRPGARGFAAEDLDRSNTERKMTGFLRAESSHGIAEGTDSDSTPCFNSASGGETDITSSEIERDSNVSATWPRSDEAAASSVSAIVIQASASLSHSGTTIDSADAFVKSSCDDVEGPSDTAISGAETSAESRRLDTEHFCESLSPPVTSVGEAISSSSSRSDSGSGGADASAANVGGSANSCDRTVGSSASNLSGEDCAMAGGPTSTILGDVAVPASAMKLNGSTSSQGASVRSTGHVDPAAADTSPSHGAGAAGGTSLTQPLSTVPPGPETNDMRTKQGGTQQVFSFYLPTSMCGLFIGKKGRNVNHLKAKSGAFIHVEALPTARDRHLCVIKGTGEAVRKAVDAIIERFPQLAPDLADNACVDSVPVVANTVGAIDVSRLQLQLVPHSAVNVILAAVAGATRAFVQLPTHPTYQSLEILSATLSDVYSGSRAGEVPPSLPEPIAPGTLCAVDSEGVWYRAAVVQQCEGYGVIGACVQLRYLDYGGYDAVPLARVRQLRPDFLSLPFQAVECTLAHVKALEPADNHSENNAMSVLASFTGGLLECINIGTDNDTGLPAVELYGNNSGVAVYINELVSDAGGMEWID